MRRTGNLPSIFQILDAPVVEQVERSTACRERAATAHGSLALAAKGECGTGAHATRPPEPNGPPGRGIGAPSGKSAANRTQVAHTAGYRASTRPARLAVGRRVPWRQADQGVDRSRLPCRAQCERSTPSVRTQDQPFPGPFQGTSRTRGGLPLRLWTSNIPAFSNAAMALDLSLGESCQSDSSSVGGLIQSARSVSVRNLRASSISGAFACPEATAAAIWATGIGPLMNRPSLRSFRTGSILVTGICQSGAPSQDLTIAPEESGTEAFPPRLIVDPYVLEL